MTGRKSRLGVRENADDSRGMITTPTQRPCTADTMRVGARILQVVLAELQSNSDEEVGIALSIVLATTPRRVRDVFESRYANDRLQADDSLGQIEHQLQHWRSD